MVGLAAYAVIKQQTSTNIQENDTEEKTDPIPSPKQKKNGSVSTNAQKTMQNHKIM